MIRIQARSRSAQSAVKSSANTTEDIRNMNDLNVLIAKYNGQSGIVKARIHPDVLKVLRDRTIASDLPQRNISHQSKAEYSNAMKRGEWGMTGDTIKISSDGLLVDGNHRAEAAVDAQVSIETGLAINVPASEISKIDTGKKRSRTNTAQLSGDFIPPPNNTETKVALRFMNAGDNRSPKNRTNQHENDIWLKYRDSIRHVSENHAGKARTFMNDAAVASAFVRALVAYPSMQDDIDRFAVGLNQGWVVNGKDEENRYVSMVKGRIEMEKKSNAMTGSASKAKRIYLLVERAIENWCNGRISGNHIAMPKSELFPIVED